MEQQNNRNDEEWYALLDTALRDERLVVSEDLIGKVLRRAGEASVVPKRRKKPEYRRYLPYAGAAAAAVLFVLLGKGAGAVRKSESCAPESPKQEMNAGYDGMYFQGECEAPGASGEAQTNSHGQGFPAGIQPTDDSTGGNKGIQDGAVMKPASDGTSAAGLALEEYKIPEGLCLAFEAAGYPVLDTTAAVWKREEALADWEKELTMLFREGDCAVEAAPGSIENEEPEGEVFYQNGEELYCFGAPVEAMLAVKTERGTFFAVKTVGAETVVCFLK